MSQMTKTNTQSKTLSREISTERIVMENRWDIIQAKEQELTDKVNRECERNVHANGDDLRSQYVESLLARIIDNINDRVEEEIERNPNARKFDIKMQYIHDILGLD